MLTESFVNAPHYLTHVCSPGEYIVETDGEIIDVELKRIKMSPILLGISPNNIEQVYEMTEWYDVEDPVDKLGYIKEALIRYYSEASFDLRNTVIPDYKLQNAVLGVYDEKTLASYRTTIQRFRDEFYRLKEAIESAKTLEELKAVKADFPAEIISAK